MVNKFKNLGIYIDPHLKWDDHVDYICQKVSKRIGMLSRIRDFIDVKSSKLIFNSMILSLVDYCSVVWSNCADKHIARIQRLQNRAARVILRKGKRTHINDMLDELKWCNIKDRMLLQDACMAYRCVNKNVPSYLQNIFVKNHEIHTYNTRSANKIHLNAVRSNSGKRCFEYRAAILWNLLEQNT